MSDDTIHTRIEQLVSEEHDLWEREGRGDATADDRNRLASLQVALDQCWDLLRQRRARAAAGLNPDDAEVRDASVVEGYEQ